MFGFVPLSYDESQLKINEVTREQNEVSRKVNEVERQIRDVAFSLLEEYYNSKNYVPLNKVTYNGSTYQNIVGCKSVPPTNTANWILIAQKGTDGMGVGDMTKSEYDLNGNGIVDDSEKLGGKLPSSYVQQSDLTAHKAETSQQIANIIVTPAEGISEQEIIDARFGEESLGIKIGLINSDLTEFLSILTVENEIWKVEV